MNDPADGSDAFEEKKFSSSTPLHLRGRLLRSGW
jgi:hypothetical protein